MPLKWSCLNMDYEKFSKQEHIPIAIKITSQLPAKIKIYVW